MRQSGIYKITNMTNGHIYIGQSVDLKRRKYKHFYELKNKNHNNPYLQKAFNKYGKENFVFDVLLFCEPSELTEHEQRTVDALNPQYNIHKQCVTTPKGLKRSDDARKRFSQSRMGIVFSEEHIKNLSLSHVGHRASEETRKKQSVFRMGNKYNLGRKPSEETRKKMSDAQKTRWAKIKEAS